MTDVNLRQRAIALYDDFTHAHRDRRRFMADMTRLAGSLSAAELLVAGIAASPAAAAIVSEDDPRVTGRMETWRVAPGRMLTGYRASPKAGRPPRPAVMVVHENRGLQPYTRDVARRLAVEGFEALAPDFLAPSGGTPLGDDDKARAMISALDLPRTVQDAVATLGWLAKQPGGSGKVGAVGFCWGGGMVNRVAVLAPPDFKAGVAYYGAQPPADYVASIKAPLLLHYGGLDQRINAGIPGYEAALKGASKRFEVQVYPNVNHAFNNDTGDRYDKTAADLAWSRTVAFFKENLGAPPKA
jgi:carboxymethylenebutenolidase